MPVFHHLDETAVVCKDAAYQAKHKSCAVLFGRKIWLKDFPPKLVRNPRPCTTYLHLHSLLSQITASSDIDSLSPLHGVNGIFNKIDKDTLDLLRYESTREMGVN